MAGEADGGLEELKAEILSRLDMRAEYEAMGALGPNCCVPQMRPYIAQKNTIAAHSYPRRLLLVHWTTLWTLIFRIPEKAKANSLRFNFRGL